ncbi:hypothetical protein MHW47_34720 [Streptomyces sp. OfavH-34-F]|uniref:hypothetical protein n=1 Tax=Streptomyces sp. OfavH-34-F TaxID=2917760 RepID=UPI001EF195A2|nr:hypothetical protein [Streptomyces sp. OfavH-34-F]MCG7529573.1 hypothetical protein [Streptomyces sp. OfavH-34-F]
MLSDDDHDLAYPKTKTYPDRRAILEKLGARAVLWERAARDATTRAADYEDAANEILRGATFVTVGRTTYVIADDRDQTGDADVSQA